MELLIRIKEKENISSKEEYVKSTNKGDTIVIKNDNGYWSPRELTNPEWRIFQIPSLLESEAKTLSMSEIDLLGTKEYTWTRQYYIDLDSDLITPRIKEYLNDNTRINQKLYLDSDEKDLLLNLVISKGEAVNYGY